LVGVVVGGGARGVIDRLRQSIAVRIGAVGDNIPVGVVDFGQAVEEVKGVVLRARRGENRDAVAASVVGVAEACEKAAGVVVRNRSLAWSRVPTALRFKSMVQWR
jgi:hypothetical protein